MSEQQSITMEVILSVFKNTREEKRPKDIKQEVIAMLYPEVLLIDPQVEKEISDAVDRLLKEDRKEERNSFLVYSNGKYKKRKNVKPPVDGEEETVNSVYTGTAGECAVMSELLFRGYNANRMMVDDGVDIVAAKDNIYYYIQVKTTTIRNGRIYARINRDSFNRYNKQQCRYIIVARYREKGADHNMFFVFNSADIEQAAYGRYINQGEEVYTIKIRFNERTGEPILYDDREKEISWNLNRFDL